MVEQGVDQRSRGMAGRGMNDQPGRFVQHEDVGVLEKNIQRNFLRHEFRRRRRRNFYVDDVVRAEFVVRFFDLAVDPDVPALISSCHRARERSAVVRRQPAVQTDGRTGVRRQRALER